MRKPHGSRKQAAASNVPDQRNHLVSHSRTQCHSRSITQCHSRTQQFENLKIKKEKVTGRGRRGSAVSAGSGVEGRHQRPQPPILDRGGAPRRTGTRGCGDHQVSPRGDCLGNAASPRQIEHFPLHAESSGGWGDRRDARKPAR